MKRILLHLKSQFLILLGQVTNGIKASPMVSQMRLKGLAYWASLNHREQKLLMILAIFLVVSIYYLSYTALKGSVDSKRRLYQEKLDTLAWMQAAQSAFFNGVQHKTSPKQTSAKVLNSITQAIEQSAFKSVPYSLQQNGEMQFQLGFDEVAFDVFIKWLLKLISLIHLNIIDLSIEPKEEPGLVKLQLILGS